MVVMCHPRIPRIRYNYPPNGNKNAIQMIDKISEQRNLQVNNRSIVKRTSVQQSHLVAQKICIHAIDVLIRNKTINRRRWSIRKSQNAMVRQSERKPSTKRNDLFRKLSQNVVDARARSRPCGNGCYQKKQNRQRVKNFKIPTGSRVLLIIDQAKYQN
jgi:hypothetical protein